MKPQILTLNITSDWHIGSGEEAGSYADALALKTAQNLPFIPGKSIKGLFREAMQQGVEYGWFQTDIQLIDLLFGQRGYELPTQGALNFSSAFLSEEETAYFVQEKALAKHLFRVLHSTAINNVTGVAENHSLRALEVVVPMSLSSQISLNSDHSEYQTLKALPLAKWLQETSMLILNLGAKRHRGLGQVQLKLQDAAV